MDNDKSRNSSYPIREQFDEEFDLSKLDPRNLPGYQHPKGPCLEEVRVSIVILRNGGSQ